jgi:aminoglycoside 6-adenylyltransferase
MRAETEIKKLIVDFGTKDERVRAIILNGSRANRNVMPDKFQDFDIVFLVRQIRSFTKDHLWTDIFGKKLIWQLPDAMRFITQGESTGFGYLMLFEDGTRIDLTLFPLEKYETDFKLDSLTTVWLDKDSLFTNIQPSNDRDYHVEVPPEQEFFETCNEFWWVSTYVAKALARHEITYAKKMLETVVRPMFMKLIEWKIGVENDFSVSVGYGGKFISKYLDKDCYSRILDTYADADVKANWQALFVMTDLFKQFSTEVSASLKFKENKEEQKNTMKYLRDVYREQPGE